MATKKTPGAESYSRNRGTKAKPHGQEIDARSSRSKTDHPPQTPNATPGRRVAEPGAPLEGEGEGPEKR